MLIIGVTGLIGSGKTTIAQMLVDRGACVLNADQMAHQLIEPQGKCFKKVLKSFGQNILDKEGRIDRQQLGKIVFQDKKKIKILTDLIYPEVVKRTKAELKRLKGKTMSVVIDAPMLIEAGMHQLVDELIVVKSNRRLQWQRTGLRKMSKKDFLSRLRLQMPLAQKIKFASIVIDNRGSLKQTQREVEAVWQRILIRNNSK